MTEPTSATPPSGPGGGGRYRFESRIATGGMGEVWRATDTVLGREVAVKVLKSEYAGDPTFRSRFETEARNAAALHHQNVASVFDFGELPATEDGGGTGRAFLVMELVRGEPLSALLRGGERMPAATACDLLAQAADALAAAHDLGIVHRDVKPANLLVTPDRIVKITDFGIARAANAAALTQTGQVVGTPQYLSPEQAEGKPATGASDIYSLGVVLYECLAGRRPFDADSPIATALAHLRQEPPPLPDDVPAGLRETVGLALAKDPADRFANVRDFAAALRGEPVGPGTGAVPSATEAATVVDRAVPVTGGATAREPDTGGDDHDAPSLAPPPGPTDEREPRRRIAGWLPWLAAAVAVLVIVLVVSQLNGRDPGGSADDPDTEPASPTASTSAPPRTTSAAPTRSASPTQVEIDESDYLGRPRSEARRELRALGLLVNERAVNNPGEEEAGTVAGVSPSGTLDARSTVTLSYYGDPPREEPPTSTPASPSTSPGDGASEETEEPEPTAPSANGPTQKGSPSIGPTEKPEAIGPGSAEKHAGTP